MAPRPSRSAAPIMDIKTAASRRVKFMKNKSRGKMKLKFKSTNKFAEIPTKELTKLKSLSKLKSKKSEIVVLNLQT